MKLFKISQVSYQYVGNCRNVCEEDGGSVFEDANEMQQIVEQEDLTYGENTFFHNPEIQITEKEFEELIGITLSAVRKELNISSIPSEVFIGKNYNFVFIYDDNTGLHHFWRK